MLGFFSDFSYCSFNGKGAKRLRVVAKRLGDGLWVIILVEVG